MILLELYGAAALVCYGMLLAWTFDKEEAFDPYIAVTLLFFSMVVPFAFVAMKLAGWLSSVRTKFFRWWL